MSDEKEKKDKAEGTTENNIASRARNQTVVLTPELTGQVRAMLGGDSGGKDPLRDLGTPVRWDQNQSSEDGYVKPRRADRGTGKIPRNDIEKATSAQPVQSAKQVQTQSVKTPSGNTRIVAFLISFDNVPQGEVYEIRVGRWLLTSRPTGHEDYILVEDETISPLHAIVRATEQGKIQVLDQLSEHGTGVCKAGSDQEQEITGAMTNLDHGDKVRFGKRHFVVCAVPVSEKSAS